MMTKAIAASLSWLAIKINNYLINTPKMSFLSLELLLFIGIIFIYTRLRKLKIYPLEMVRGLTIYLPPKQEDFEILEASNKPSRESVKGK
jgi:hypothetical protein